MKNYPIATVNGFHIFKDSYSGLFELWTPDGTFYMSFLTLQEARTIAENTCYCER